MKESNNQLDGNQLTEDIDTTEEINMDPSLKLVKAPKGMKEAVMRKIYEHEHPEIFDGLSEEDRKALWLGREMLAKEGERKKAPDIQPDKVKPRRTRKTRRFTAKVYGLVAVVAVAMVAVGITSVGGPQHLAQMVDEMFAGRSQVNMDSVAENVVEVSHEEEKAYQDVKNQLGFEPARMHYKPIDMKFVKAWLDKDVQMAYFSYEYKERLMTIQMVVNYRNSSLKLDFEDEIISEYNIQVPEAIFTVKSYEIKESSEIEYSAEAEYKDVKYIISGVIEKKEFDDILKNLKFF